MTVKECKGWITTWVMTVLVNPDAGATAAVPFIVPTVDCDDRHRETWKGISVFTGALTGGT